MYIAEKNYIFQKSKKEVSIINGKIWTFIRKGFWRKILTCWVSFRNKTPSCRFDRTVLSDAFLFSYNFNSFSVHHTLSQEGDLPILKLKKTNLNSTQRRQMVPWQRRKFSCIFASFEDKRFYL